MTREAFIPAGQLDMVLRWRSIVVVDLVESVRLMESHERAVIHRWRHFVQAVNRQVLAATGGRLVKSLGDGLLLEFEEIRDAVTAAFALQQLMSLENTSHPEDECLELRVGVHVAEVVIDDLDVFGRGVNLAARLTTLASPGDIVASMACAERLLDGVDAHIEDLGDCFVKHLESPIRAFRLRAPTSRDKLPAWRGADKPPSTSPVKIQDDTPRIAVLRFDLGPGAGLSQTVGELVAEAISNRLSAATAARVISRLSCQVLGGRKVSLSEVRELLDCDYVVSGRCSGSLDHFVAMIELAHLGSQQVVWSERITTSVAELLQANDDVSAALATQIMRVVTETELRRAITQPLPHLSGHKLQQSATQLMHRSSGREFQHARVMLSHLLDRYPRAASSHAWMADWYVLSVTKGITPASPELAARALDHTRRALAADPECSLALAVQAFVHCHIQGDLDQAERRLDEALAANPNEALAWLFSCVVHGFRGEGEMAWRAAQRALQLSPLDPQKHYFQSLAASAALSAGRHAETISLAADSLRMNRSHLPTLRTLAIAQVECGDMDNARASTQQILSLAPDFTIARYLANAPRGAEHGRHRYARALRDAGIPNH